MGVTKTQVVKFIRKGEVGENGISIFVLPASLTAKLGTANIYKVQIALYDGGVQIPYNDPNNGNMLCSTLPSSDTYTWSFTVDNGKFYYNIYTSPKELGLMTIPFTVTYKDVTYDSVINIQVVKDGDKGDKGDRGPTLRGPQAWSDCATGYAFQAGGAGEKWQDVVLYNGNYYSCKKSHTKTTSNYPGSTTDTNNGYWQLGDNVELVATKILLATYALVKNLGVEAIDMKDANGNILFQAKDGAVTCKTGTFENVTVQGTLKGVTGTFKSLNCINNSGTVVGEISFDSSGRLWFSGDMYHQGYDSSKGRGYRFYTSDVWCRGQFGASERNVLVVNGSYGYYYTKGMSYSGTYVAFTKKTSSNNTGYYVLPMYGTSGDYAGFPVDVVVFNINSSTVYNYELSMYNSQRVLVVNANDDQGNVKIFSNGNLVTWAGGEMAEVIKLANVMRPTPDSTLVGCGLMVGAFRDNNW